MEDLVMGTDFWRKKRVFVTGHTGFKGGWLSLWLSQLEADVFGYSLSPTKANEFYLRVFSEGFIGDECIADIMQYEKIKKCIKEFEPEVIFHLAAQPLVRYSYENPVKTFFDNAMGVVNVLEAVRSLKIKPVIVNITTDKVYENKEWVWAYREQDKLAGNDPYSASKACSEIITKSYLESFFKHSQVMVATARAGNVIGGGDMSQDRLVPDYLRAFSQKKEIFLRNPMATRPWQHVLDPLAGYLKLAENLSGQDGFNYCGSWNFGPLGDPIAVGEIIEKLSNISGGKNYKEDQNSNPHEAQTLMLDSAKARQLLGWKPMLTIDKSLAFTFDWFSKSKKINNMQDFSRSQILEYQSHG